MRQPFISLHEHGEIAWPDASARPACATKISLTCLASSSMRSGYSEDYLGLGSPQSGGIADQFEMQGEILAERRAQKFVFEGPARRIAQYRLSLSSWRVVQELRVKT
jgi:hypothetical protein